ncbi:MAG: metalloregulator ArsR/SmtB family transcription factor [Planctomycetes bacterium]|nr:metalloregulator ArsR/SmtB family transcription factor [Planctomycetota bacterium]
MEVKTAVTALTALAQESRLRIFRLLVQAGETGLAAGEIADELDIPAATLTFHLKELSHAGLIDSQREGRSIRYALRVDGIRDLLNYLLHDCCKGRPELCGGGQCGHKKRERTATASMQPIKAKRLKSQR